MGLGIPCGGGALPKLCAALLVDVVVEGAHELVPSILAFGVEAVGVRFAVFFIPCPQHVSFCAVVMQGAGKGAAAGVVLRVYAHAAKGLCNLAYVHCWMFDFEIFRRRCRWQLWRDK